FPAVRDRAAAQLDSGIAERPGGIGERPRSVAEDPAAGAEARRDQRIAEQKRADLGQRQQPHQRPAALGEEKVGALAASALDRPAPLWAVKDRPVRMLRDEAV